MNARRAAGLIVLAFLVLQLAGLRAIGLTDDDDFYIPAGIAYAGWVGRAVTFDRSAWSRAAIDRAFELNHEHPPVAKYVFGLCHALFPFLGPFDAARVGTVFFATLIAALTMALALTHLGARRGLVAGGLAVLLLLLLPRFYFHAHAATLDVPVAATYLLTAALILWGERSRTAALLAGPAFALALGTKLNAPFLLVSYGLFVLLTRRLTRRTALDGAGLSLPSLPLALCSMLVVGPLGFIALWPWLWFDTWSRVSEYVAFHLHHYGIYFLYFGRVYDHDPFAPWHAPFFIGAITTPLATLVLAAAGLRFAAPRMIARLRRPRAPGEAVEPRAPGRGGEAGEAGEAGQADQPGPAGRAGEADLLLLTTLHAVVAIGAVAFSGGPKYGGEKLFTPFFPFLCLLAGYGGLCLLEAWWGAGRRALGIGAAVIAVAVVSALGLTVRFGAYGLSAYNGLIGGLRGATAAGFERQYYDVAFRDLVEWLDREAPPGLRVHFLPNNWEYVRTYGWYGRSGDLRSDIRVVANEADADWVVITHERRFARYGADLERYRTRPVLRERRVDGTPIWSVVKRR